MTVKSDHISRKSLRVIEYGGLIIITIATLIAGAQEILFMVEAQRVTLADLLLLFIYLEIIAMVAVYLESGKLPIRMPLYIAIVALARYLALDSKGMDSWKIVSISASIIMLAFAVLVIRFGHTRFSYKSITDKDKGS